VSLKDWLRSATSSVGKRPGRDKLTVSDLVNLERYEEALTQLQERLRLRPSEHHSRLKLAELLMKVGRRPESVEEYLRVAEGFERDGFYNKASALVSKVARLMPGDERLEAKARRLKRIKRLDHLRAIVVDNLPRTLAMKVEGEWTSLVQGELLSRLSEEQLRRLLPHLTLRELRENEEIVSAGVRMDELLWIVAGQVNARVILASGALTDIRSFGGGDLIGEQALFAHQPWPAVYVAAKKTMVLVLDRSGLEKALVGEEDPRGLLEGLRADRNDEKVQGAVSKMTAMREGS